MILTEFEAKQLLAAEGLQIPASVVVTEDDELSAVADVEGDLNFTFPVFVKAQVLHGDRASMELVQRVDAADELEETVRDVLARKDRFEHDVIEVLVEQGMAFEKKFYLAITYDTMHRQPVLQFSAQAGTGIEGRIDSIETIPFSALEGPADDILEDISLDVETLAVLHDAVQRIWAVFSKQDATLVEINPFVITEEGEGYCLDAKIEVEDTASFRHKEWELYPERSPLGRPPTEREEDAHAVSRSDHRGVAGESFFEFPGGEIGVMASGGGASTLAMDALLTVGLQPANYTEYSGNPTREKVGKLADVVLSIPDLKGLYVVGSTANFTDIYDTLAGVIDGLLRSDYAEREGFAMVVRRGGPRWEEAFGMIRERLEGRPIRYRLYGPEFPITETAAVMKELINE